MLERIKGYAVRVLNAFRTGVVLVRHQLQVRDLVISDRCLEEVFGEGFPLQYTWHEFDGLGQFIANHNFFSRPGRSIADTIRENDGNPQQVQAAEKVVETYVRFSKIWVARSNMLTQLIESTESGWEASFADISEKEIELLKKIGGIQLKSNTFKDFIRHVEPNFGKLFRAFVLGTITVEELDEYEANMVAAIQEFIATLPQ